MGRFAFGCGIVCFVGRAGWWGILTGSSAGYSNGDGVGKRLKLRETHIWNDGI